MTSHHLQANQLGPLFDRHPDPMWIYDPSDLRFLAVNAAAVTRYGYSRAEFLAMTIADIRPLDDAPLLKQSIAHRPSWAEQASIWRHRRKDGSILHVDIAAADIVIDGRSARLVAARDVSKLVEDDAIRALAHEAAERAQAQAIARRFRALFETSPSCVLVIDGSNRIIASSDAYLRTFNLSRAHLAGASILDLLAGSRLRSHVKALEASLERVRESGLAEAMPLLALPHAGAGTTRTEVWSLVNSPVLTSENEIDFIVHRAENMTDLVRPDGAAPAPAAEPHRPGKEAKADAPGADAANQIAALRSMQRLLNAGLWRLDLQKQQFSWSHDLFRIYGLDPETFQPSAQAYLALMHEEDRYEFLCALRRFVASDETVFEFEHRVLGGDGALRHVRGIGEFEAGSERRYLSGVVRDVTAEMSASRRFAEAEALTRIASRAAQLGGWRLELKTNIVHWSEATARIHGAPETRSLPLDAALAFCEPSCRDSLRHAIALCIERGEAYDQIISIKAGDGERVWVRTIGEAEYEVDGKIVAVRGACQNVSELITARDQAQARQERLERTLESISDAFCLLDEDFRLVYLNAQAERLLQEPKDRLLGRLFWQIPAHDTELKRYCEQAAASGSPAEIEHFLVPLDRWFDLRLYPARDGLAIYFKDVTQERAQMRELKLLRSAVARQNDILLITEAEPIDAPMGPRIVFANEAFYRRTGFTPQEVIGATPRILQGPETDRTQLDRIRDALRHWRPTRAELLNYDKFGEPFWLELDITPVADETGWFTHWVAVQRDITERKTLEERARQTEERLALISKASFDIIWDWDLRNDRVWWSAGYEKILGHNRDDAAPGAESWIKHIHPDDRTKVVESIRSAIDGYANDWKREYRFACADGRYAQIIDRGFILRTPDGAAVRMVGSMVDVSEMHALNEKLKQSQKLEALGQLTGGVAHDFNNLLTVILGNSETLATELSGLPHLAELAALSANAAERAAELTQRLLAFARRQPLTPKPTDLNNLVSGMSTLLRRTLSENITICFDLDPQLWTANADPGQLEVAILNLALNARDAMPEGGELTIRTANLTLDPQDYATEASNGPEFVMISVSDTGFGMTQEVVDRAFEPFFTTKDVSKGSGLGLSMVYGFVTQSGGSVRIRSQPGQGATLSLYFPRTDEDCFELDESGSAEAARGREHVLLVEDNKVVCSHVQTQLRSLGYRVTTASDGQEALEALRTCRDVDLLLTDLVMAGGMNGQELAQQAKALCPDLPILFTSGYAQDLPARIPPGMQFLAKPYRRAELAGAVRRALGVRTQSPS